MAGTPITPIVRSGPSVLVPQKSTDRLCLGGATDDAASLLQVAGEVKVAKGAAGPTRSYQAEFADAGNQRSGYFHLDNSSLSVTACTDFTVPASALLVVGPANFTGKLHTSDGTHTVNLSDGTKAIAAAGPSLLDGLVNATNQFVAGPITSIDQYGAPNVAPFVLNAPFKNSPPGGTSETIVWLKTRTDPAVDAGDKPSECKIRLVTATAGAPTLSFQTGQHEIANAGVVSLQPFGGDVTLCEGGGNNFFNPGGSGITFVGTVSDDGSGSIFQVAGVASISSGLFTQFISDPTSLLQAIGITTRSLTATDGVTSILEWGTRLNLPNIPRQTDDSGLSAGDVWCDTSAGNVLKVV